MLEDRIVLGFVGQKGAQMALEDHWRDAIDNYGEKLPHGRGVARLAGKYSRIQGFYAGDPIDRPESEQLFPPKVGTRPAHTAELPSSTSPALTGQLLLDPSETGADDGPPDDGHPRQRRRHTV
jgi:hypothetical protein